MDEPNSESARSQRVAVAFARALTRSRSQRMCHVCREVLQVTGAGVTLMVGEQAGPLCASSPEVGILEEIQFTAGEGPCRDAFASNRAVHAPRLDDEAFARWPSFVEAARRSGVGGVFAIPLSGRGVQVGVMTLYQAQPGDLTPAQQDDSVTLAGVVAATVLSLQSEASPGEFGPGLDGGELYRAEIHQAAGMLAVKLRIPVADAMARLRAHALAIDVPVSMLAADVVARRVEFDDDSQWDTDHEAGADG